MSHYSCCSILAKLLICFLFLVVQSTVIQLQNILLLFSATAYIYFKTLLFEARLLIAIYCS